MRTSVEYIEHDPLQTDAPGDMSLFDLILVGQEAMATVPRRSKCLANGPAVSSEESARRQSTPLSRKPATDLPPVPVILPEGSELSPKRRGGPPKVAPPSDDVAGPLACLLYSRISPNVGVDLELNPCLQRRVILRLVQRFPNAGWTIRSPEPR